MGFYIQVKLNNIFRAILFSDEDLQIIDGDKEKLVNQLIEKGCSELIEK